MDLSRFEVTPAFWSREINGSFWEAWYVPPRTPGDPEFRLCTMLVIEPEECVDCPSCNCVGACCVCMRGE